MLNNPLSATDPTGLWCVWEDGTHDDDPDNGGASSGDCTSQGGHWDTFDTITGIFQDGNGNVTQINYAVPGGTFSYNPQGMTLEGFDATLNSYQQGPETNWLGDAVGPIGRWWNSTSLGRWLNFQHSKLLVNPGAMNAISCGLAPDTTNDINALARSQQAAISKPSLPADDSSGGGSGLASFGAARQNMMWMYNSNTTKNGGQSLSVQPNGAIATSGGAAIIDYANSAGSCLQNP